MTPARRAAVASFRQALVVMQAALEAFAKSEGDYVIECRLTDAAAYVGNAVDEIEKAEAGQ